MDESIKVKVKKTLTNRIFIFSTIICIMFLVLFIKLFEMQIVNGSNYNSRLTVTYTKSLDFPASRGNMYDRFGRPLAVNKSVYTVKTDPSTKVENLNEVIYNLVKLFESSGENYLDDFPISKEKPYTYDFDNEKRKERWMDDMNISLETADQTPSSKHPTTAEEAFQFLRKEFEIPEDLSDDEARKILSIRSMIYLGRYQQYTPITLAYNVKPETIVAIEEQGEKYKGVFIDIDTVREYPSGGYTSHIVGYLGRITDPEELEEAKKNGYSPTDLVGKTGLEVSFEERLRGRKGKQQVEINANGRPIKSYEPVPAIPGNNLYTSLDLEFNNKCVEIVEKNLEEILIKKIVGTSPREASFTMEKIMTSLVNSNNVPIKPIMASAEGEPAYILKSYILENLSDAKIETDEDIGKIKDTLIVGIEDGDISSTEILLTMHQLDIITGDERFVINLKKGRISPRQTIIDKIKEKELTPQMLALDPYSASAIVVEVETGNVLASVSYPSYDNNQFVNNTNDEYLEKIFKDPTSPMLNRPFNETRAPGSTFKMISAVAGLESGFIRHTSKIYDKVSFKDAGLPYANCWSKYSHGHINASEALEVSCNYFFSSMVYGMGNSKEGTESVSINALNKYMEQFGMNSRSGVEIGEARDRLPEDLLAVSSPQYKEYIYKEVNPEVTPREYQWVDGDTVRTSFGQAFNNYTPAVMAKYISTIASGGYRIQLHLMNREETFDNKLVKEYEPVVETVVEMKPETIKTIYDGMLRVTEGKRGTARGVFKDFPIKVAGKTGTAQEEKNRNDHSSFGGFAPYDDPQIAVYVMIPYGDTKVMAAPATQIGKEIIGEYLGLNHEVEKANEVNSLSL